MDLMPLLHFDQHLAAAIAQHGPAIYAILFAIVFVEIGVVPMFFLPGDPLLFLCGAFCATGAINVWIVAPVLFVAAVGGSILSYLTGRAIGARVFVRDYRWLDKAALLRTHAFYENYGGLTFLISPFVAVEMTFARFLAAVTVGAAVWVVTLVVGGYWFGNVPIVLDHMGSIVLLGIGIGVGSLVVNGVYRYVRSRAEEARLHRDSGA